MVEMDTIVSLCKRRGFVFQSSEIYGGLGSAWDYGPLGVEYKNNVKQLWWRDNVHLRHDMVGIDAAISMHPRVWEASGHVAGFSDPFTGCLECRRQFRADHVEEAIRTSKWWRSLSEWVKRDGRLDLCAWAESEGRKLAPNLPVVKNPSVALSFQEEDRIDRLEDSDLAEKDLLQAITGTVSGLPCPNCGGSMSSPEPASLMLEVFLGPVKETATKTYMRPETAQGIFVNFENVLQASRKKLPFGIAQIGKSFRNEITPGNFTFRTREFEQMEIEFFVMPGSDEEWHQRWIDERFLWYQRYGIRKENLRLREHGEDELAFYAKRCVDVEYLFPMGWSELEGIANRTDYDLKRHGEFSGKSLDYFDDETKHRIVPYVIEPSAGADRSTLAFLIDAYHKEEVRGENRVVLKLHPELSPIKVAVLPLLKKNSQIVETAKKICDDLKKRWFSVYDDTASIGRLYRRQDEVGTPFCVTVDVQTVGDDKQSADEKVTVRSRDDMQQIRVPISALNNCLEELMAGKWPSWIEQCPVQQAL